MIVGVEVGVVGPKWPRPLPRPLFPFNSGPSGERGVVFRRGALAKRGDR